MFKKIFLGIAIFLLSMSIKAQNNIDGILNNYQESLSPSEKRFYKTHFDIEDLTLINRLDNPANYISIKKEDNFLTRSTIKKDSTMHNYILSTGYSNGEVKGDYLIHEGNKYSDFNVLAGGIKFNKTNTTYGTARFSKGIHKGYVWNTERYADLYLPYIIADSVGGNFEFEEYLVKGGYAFDYKNTYIGVSGHYKGDYAYRLTDPRIVNTTSWVGLNIGAAKYLGNHLFSASIDYTINKQRVNVRNWRPGQQDRFFFTYGFGQVDYQNSIISFGINRMHYSNIFTADISIKSPENNNFSYFIGLKYKNESTKAEEVSLKDLFYTKNHRFEPFLSADWKWNSFTINLITENNYLYRQGLENIYESYKVADDLNIYDFRIIDTRNNYLLTEYFNNTQAKLTYSIDLRNSISLFIGNGYDYRNETYRGTDLQIENTSVIPSFGMGHKGRNNNLEWNINAAFLRKIPLKNNYNVNITGSNPIDFQLAFVPYAFYSAEKTAIKFNTNFTREIKKLGKLGLDLNMMYSIGRRGKGIEHTELIPLKSATPTISFKEDIQDETWASIKLFLIF